MGLTRAQTGKSTDRPRDARAGCNALIALAGNPNVGKSTIFNALTGMKQHTGNWTGKTVECAKGTLKRKGERYCLVDLPGCYSLFASSPEEEVARDFIKDGNADCVVIVCDASCLARNLNLALQTLELTSNAVVCVNLIDEARKHGIIVNTEMLQELLGVQVVATSAVKGQGLDKLITAIQNVVTGAFKPNYTSMSKLQNCSACGNEQDSPCRICPFGKTGCGADTEQFFKRADSIAASAVTKDADTHSAKQLKLDRILTGKVSGVVIMLLLLGLVFYITMVGANYPSGLLNDLLFGLLDKLRVWLTAVHIPAYIVSAICDGVLSTLFAVVSVMLPPMAIFFPMFTILEDLGYLPRVAFNLDKAFCRCSACGKQALTMCMGFGCNAAGVIGCRIIESPRERLIAIITNSFVPCNGRFPTFIALISIFCVFGAGVLIDGAISALLLLLFIIIGISATLLVSKLLSVTALRGEPSSFVLELPPFRKPRIGQIIVRSIFDRTLFVLGRAIAVAAPAGLVIWLLASINVGDGTALSVCVDFFDPIGAVMGLDGAIIMAFLLGLPANELIVPLILMIYMGTDTFTGATELWQMRQLLTDNGWTIITALNVMLLMLFHSPCSTTLITIKKETGSWGWTALSLLLPSTLGVLLCLAVNGISVLAGLF